MKSINTKDLLKESAVATIMVLLATYLISFIPWSLEYGKALHQGFADFDIYDLYYSGKDENNFGRDTNIVLVQLGNNRTEIEEQLKLINNYTPKVIGIDAFFEKDSTSDPGFLQTIGSMPNLVFINRYTEDGLVPNVLYNHPDKCGFGNFVGYKYSVMRTFSPFLDVDGKKHDEFAACIARLTDRKSYDKLDQRNNKLEIIDYKGNLENYTNFTTDELMQYHLSGQLQKRLQDKIVLLGLFTKDTSAIILNDLHFTPLNKVVSGKSFPDMYGVVIHANILSMILSGNYPTFFSKKITYFFAFIITFLFCLYVISRYYKKAHPSHGMFLLVQVLSILFVLYFFLKLYDWFLFKVSLEPIITAMVLSLEMFGIYESLAKWLNKKYNYKTVFKSADPV